MTHYPHPPSVHDGDAADPLAGLVRHLIALGEQALADDEAHGPDWGMYADWAWRNDIDALGSTAADVQRWLDTDATDHDADRVEAVVHAISVAHRSAGLPDPTVKVQR